MRALAPFHMDTNERNPQKPSPTALVIGLMGGIAAGKSTVGNLFVDAGFRLIDADRLAHETLSTEEVTASVIARFGPEVQASSGAIDRAALGAIVFRNPSDRADLEEIVLPPVRTRIRAELARARGAGEEIVLDAPLLLEGGWVEQCDACVFVDAAEDVRRDRAAARGWEPGEWERREAAQADLATKRSHCQFVVTTDIETPNAASQVAAIVSQLRDGREQS